MEETEELCLQREQREVSTCAAVQKDSACPPDTAGIKGSGGWALGIQKLAQETSEEWSNEGTEVTMSAP